MPVKIELLIGPFGRDEWHDAQRMLLAVMRAMPDGGVPVTATVVDVEDVEEDEEEAPA